MYKKICCELFFHRCRLESWNEGLGVLDSRRHIPVVVGTAAVTSRVAGAWRDRPRREDGGNMYFLLLWA